VRPVQRRVGPDLARAADLVAQRGCGLGRPLHLLASTGSTSDDAHQGARDGAPHGATWVAEEQTAGRGRRGHRWTSPPGEGLLFSVLARTSCPPARLPPLALVVGLAVREAVVRAAPGASVQIKWPNDVLLGGRKVAGVLVEAVTVGPRVEAVIVGVGINVHTRVFPEEIAERATSVALAGGPTPPDRAEILADVLAGLDRDMHVVLGRGLGLLRARLEAADALRGRRVRTDTGEEGTGAGLAEDGRLLLRRDDGGVAALSAGEVHLLP
jgi:BirA family biotin operon repressor/biotin-[acetyl-CoA-carboxylase] ligase